MDLCEVHELYTHTGADDRYCVKCGTPEFAIIALVDLGAELDGLVNKFGEDGQAYQGPQFWQDRVDSMGRALADSNSQLADSNKQMVIEKQKHLDTSNWALEQQDRADLSEKRETELRIFLDATNPWTASVLPNTYRCLYCKAELFMMVSSTALPPPRATTIPERTDSLSVHSNTCAFAKSVKEVALKPADSPS